MRSLTIRGQSLAVPRLLAFVLLAALAGFIPSRPAQAAPVFFGWGGEKIIKVMDFPKTRTFSNGGQHFDLGYRVKQFTIFMMPIWNYDGTWCGYIPDEPEKYFDFDRARLENLAATNSPPITLPAEPTFDWWDNYGGKIVVGLLILAYIVFVIRSRKKKAEAPQAP